MALQKSVNLYQAAAVQGDRASQNPFVYTPQNYTAGADITVGSFVWESAEATDPKQVLNTGTGAPLGFVERILAVYNYDLTSEGTLIIPKGQNVTAVALRGDFYIPANTTVTVGMAVFANTTTGAATFAEAGSSQSGAVETSWRAMTAGNEGDMIIISNEAPVVASSGGSSPDLSSYAKADLSNVTGQLPIANGGTGVTAVGTAGQVLTVNSGADGTEWTTPTGA
ncbi:hypothetical protein [Cloacibacillus sp. An23]|uniref:structural cement protein Gp24 n=1 Tax=Cloacibacillus sp. An23 TaxID=1965591 RepID=UPI000B365C62|nr:hypothetical protein [Cloacibacillus sp. An23]OUO94798.1 hypothetical protein B5F39_02710 [Cloacibacillus sp. An23]